MKTLTTEEAKTVLEALGYGHQFAINALSEAPRSTASKVESQLDTIAAAIRIMEAEDVKEGNSSSISKASAVDDVRCWMGDNDVVLSNRAYSRLVELVKFYTDRAALSAPAAPSEPAAAVSEDHSARIASQVADWRKEVERLQGLIAVAAPAVVEVELPPVDCREFHELAMDYRAAPAFTGAPKAYRALCDWVQAYARAAVELNRK